MRRSLLSLALATRQPFSEVLTWNDRDIATAWQWINGEDKG